MLKIKLFPAEYGECILVSVGEEKPYNLLIDGGLAKTYKNFLSQEIKHIKESGLKINLMVCTHMDNDHIGGLVQILKNENSDFIQNIWYNGFLQVVSDKFYSQKNNKYTDGDNEILDKIISQGTIPDEEQEVGINDGISLGVLIEEKKIPLNTIAGGQAICSELVKDRIEISKDLSVIILGPSLENIIKIEDYWKTDMVSRNYMFRVPDRIRLTEAFEYQIERIKAFYIGERVKISENEDLVKYIGDLNEIDDSIVNGSSISFILEHGHRKNLFLGDTIIDENVLKNIENVVGFKYRFSAIKLPHHGSRYNITHDFIHRYTADEYYCMTNSRKYGHPDLEVLAAIICHDHQFKRLVFNYPIDKARFIDKEEWKKKYNYEVIIGDGENIMERRLK